MTPEATAAPRRVTHFTGDFNTPRESSHFRQLRKPMTHAFETAGRGLADTWPVPIPVLSLDHIWTTPGLRVVQCRLGGGVADHRPVMADLAL